MSSNHLPALAELLKNHAIRLDEFWRVIKTTNVFLFQESCPFKKIRQEEKKRMQWKEKKVEEQKAERKERQQEKRYK